MQQIICSSCGVTTQKEKKHHADLCYKCGQNLKHVLYGLAIEGVVEDPKETAEKLAEYYQLNHQ